jgi:NADH/NAD ratio-sensing transcriptional regulator Rex
MLTFKVEARYGSEDRRFIHNVIAHTPEMAGQVAERFIRTRISGVMEFDPVRIIEVREVRI